MINNLIRIFINNPGVNFLYFTNRASVTLFFIPFLLVLGLSACGGGGSENNSLDNEDTPTEPVPGLPNEETPNEEPDDEEPPVEQPTTDLAINSFTSSSTDINTGQTITLNWNVAGADHVEISPDVGVVQSMSSITITPTETTQYQLVASFEDNSQQQTVQINVNDISASNITLVHKSLRLPTTEQEYRVAILMINTLGTTPVDNGSSVREFYSPQELCDLYFEHDFGVNSFFIESSYEKVQLHGTCAGWVNDRTISAGQEVSQDYVRENKDAYINLFKEAMNFADYDVFVIHVLGGGRGGNTGWTLGNSITTDQGKLSNVGIQFMTNSAVFDKVPEINEPSGWSAGDSILPTTSWAHEMIHTLGASAHANSLDCAQQVVCETGSDGKSNGYGNPFSIMGENAFASHPDVYVKSYLGWLEPNQVQTITNNGTYTIYPIETANKNLKGLRIPLSTPLLLDNNVFDTLYLEYRDAIGMDRYMVRLDRDENQQAHPFMNRYKPDGEIDRNGVLGLLRDSSQDTSNTTTTQLLDMNPTSSFSDGSIKLPGNVGKFSDAILGTGQSYTLPHNNFTLQTIGKSGDGGMKIKITFQ